MVELDGHLGCLLQISPKCSKIISYLQNTPDLINIINKPYNIIVIRKNTYKLWMKMGQIHSLSCNYHKSKAHDTGNCMHLVDALLSSYEKGTSSIEPPKPRTNNAKSWSKNKEKKAKRPQALFRIHNYQHQIESYYNKKVSSRPLELGDIVLRKVFENTKELNAGKLRTNWEMWNRNSHHEFPFKLGKLGNL